VAVPEDHRLAARGKVAITDLADEPLIVPDRRSRPHSHDLTMKLFLGAGLTARVAQIAEEKQTIVNIVSTGLGLAIVPRWTTRLAVPGVSFVPIDTTGYDVMNKLALSAAWVRGVRDPLRDALLDTLDRHLDEIEATA
jgi:DNA-binding transcriptional LysR family regulator